MSKYDYEKLYNRAWAEAMRDSAISSVGITRFDFDGSRRFGFSNVFADDQSPYDFCARIGLQVLRELSDPDTKSIKIEVGNYMFAYKSR